MKYAISLGFLLIGMQVGAVEEMDEPINDAAELRDWCKAESEAEFVAKDVTPYNWSASRWQDGNILLVKGYWRIESDDVMVECRIVKGARRKYAVYEVAVEE